MLRIIRSTDVKAVRRLFEGRAMRLAEATVTARRIVSDVRRQGDQALIRYSGRLDGVDLRREGFLVSPEEVRRAYRQVPGGLIPALRVAAANIRAAARRQLPRPWRASNGEGVRLWQLVQPLDSVVAYIPGGRFPLPSTVLMSVIPAQVAGVREIFITSPQPAPVVLVAADTLGIKKVFRLGGAQAIGAFAYGTETVPRVAKIVGPGNRYVAAAKKLVAGDCAIDFVAGPTELVIVGAQGQPRWIAADLLAQAEHDPEAVALLITPSRRFALQVQAAVVDILGRSFPQGLPVAERALAGQGRVILTGSLEEAAELANQFAPEHLTLLPGATHLLGRIRAAGSIFLGNYSAVAAGDYASGSNHILPTGGAARLRGGLSAADFVKSVSVQQLSRRGLARLRRAIVTLARSEGLPAHAYSVDARFHRHGPTA